MRSNKKITRSSELSSGKNRKSKRKKDFKAMVSFVVMISLLGAVWVNCQHLSVSGEEELQAAAVAERDSSSQYNDTNGESDSEQLTSARMSETSIETPEVASRVSSLVVAGANIFDSCYADYTLDEKISVLRSIFPDGAYWNHIGIDVSGMSEDDAAMVVTDTPCEHSYNGYQYCNIYNGVTRGEFEYEYNTQCLGFASMISDFFFGKDAPVTEFYDFDDLDIGDHIRLIYYEHSMIVIGKGDGYVKVVECNEDYENCEIVWDRILTEEDIEAYGSGVEYLTRYSTDIYG